MPPKPAVNAVAELAAEWVLSEGVKAVTRWFQRLSGGPLTSGQATDMAGQTAANINTDLNALFLSDTVLTQVTCTDLTSPSAGQGVWTGSYAGSDSGIPMGAGVAIIVSEHFARRYRGGHPRRYLPSPAAAHMADQQSWTSGFLTAVGTHWGDFVTAQELVASGGIDLGNFVNVSYYHGFTNVTYPSGRVRPVPTLRATPVVDDITAFTVNPKAGSQRRRNGQSA